jgi:enamine deaminase RidA (YjgF/YER057c/UK114 family)
LAGGFAYVSGQLSRDAEGNLVTGKVGKEVSIEKGREAAQYAVLQALSLVKQEIGLERVEQVVRLAGFIQSTGDFYAQSDLMNAASELVVELFGERGRHARTSVGVASLPMNAAVEIEITLKVKIK